MPASGQGGRSSRLDLSPPATRRAFLTGAALAVLPAELLAEIQHTAGAKAGGIANGELPLPPLPFVADLLEPALEARTINLQHGKYLAMYRIGLNHALQALQAGPADAEQSAHLWADLAEQASGYVNHVIYLANLAPPGRGGEPSPGLLARLQTDFGSPESFKSQFVAAAAGLRSDGWTVLGWHPLLQRLVIVRMGGNRDAGLPGLIPLLMLDLWEHAYFLQYQYRREEYISAWWSVINWADVNRRFERAKELTFEI
jgi:Fe-Mn family superoxide dismutase